MVYHPPRALGLLVGSLLTLWAAGVAFLLANAGLELDTGLLSFLAYVGAVAAGCMAALFAYWTYSLATLSYALDRNGLVIHWGPIRQVVPLEAIERLVPGTSAGVPRVSGISWWGHHVGKAQLGRIGDVLFYSTHQGPEQVLYVMTSERNYAISVQDPADFAREVQVRQDLGPTAEVAHHVERSGAALQPFWSDTPARALAGAAIAAAAALWLQVVLRYGDLPATLALHFPPTDPDPVVTVTGREAIFEIPRVGTLLLGLNLALGIALHTWDRMAGYVLLSAAIAVQVALFAAVVIALR